MELRQPPDNMKLPQGSNRLYCCFEGPFIIRERTGPFMYKISIASTTPGKPAAQPFLAHVSCLKRYMAPVSLIHA